MRCFEKGTGDKIIEVAKGTIGRVDEGHGGAHVRRVDLWILGAHKVDGAQQLPVTTNEITNNNHNENW